MFLGCFILVFLIAIIIIIMMAIRQARCPIRKKIAFEEIDKQLIKEESVSKIEELKRRDKNGNVIGTRESRVYGTRKTYRTTYRCKNCNNITVKVETEDIY